jgi:hypothetical protein
MSIPLTLEISPSSSTPPASEAANEGQNGLQDQGQPSDPVPAVPAVAKDTAPATSATSINLKTVLSSWAKASATDRLAVIKATEDYYNALGLEEGRAVGSKAKVLQTSTTHSSGMLYRAARLMQSPEQSIPLLTLRHTAQAPSDVANTQQNFHYTAFTEAMLAHYNGPAFLPFEPGMKIEGTSYEHLVGGVKGIQLHGINKKPGGNPSYEVDIAFHNESFFKAAVDNPFIYHGFTVQIDFTIPKELVGVIELRCQLRDLNTTDESIKLAVKKLLMNQTRITHLSTIKYYSNVKVNAEVTGITSAGRFSIFVRVPGISPSSTGAYRQSVHTLLPSHITINNQTLPLRHQFESSYCPRCRFAGHNASTCPHNPCTNCKERTHVSTNCPKKSKAASTYASVPQRSFDDAQTASTRQEVVEEPFQVQGRKGAGKKAANVATSSNAIPVGGKNSFDCLNVEGNENYDQQFPRPPPSTTSSTPARISKKQRTTTAATASPIKLVEDNYNFTADSLPPLPTLPSSTTTSGSTPAIANSTNSTQVPKIFVNSPTNTTSGNIQKESDVEFGMDDDEDEGDVGNSVGSLGSESTAEINSSSSSTESSADNLPLSQSSNSQNSQNSSSPSASTADFAASHASSN